MQPVRKAEGEELFLPDQYFQPGIHFEPGECIQENTFICCAGKQAV